MSNNNTPHSKYDVFVSFRGKDIRKDFLSHLAEAFSRKKINVFVDDKLKKGNDISRSLFEAIEGSPISLVIFSENYASSHWCLEELAKIIECKVKLGQIVIPVFYRVDPTNVRNQTKSYENAFAEHEKSYNSSDVQIWKDALEKSANLSGITSSSFQNDAVLVEEISKVVLMRLSKLKNTPVNSKKLVGIDKSISHLKLLLKKESEDVRVIGIWGMGGIGKTTISEEIFKQIYSEYDGCCFLANVREEIGRHGIKSLKEKLFSKLLDEDVKIESPNGLSHHIQKRIGHIKVLIVLDDVKDTDHLEMLFGTLDWFRSDSRIIVTSRDKQVLIANEVDEDDLHEVGVLDSREALELFNLIAFKQSHPEMEYYELSERVIEYAKGVPLVLKVLSHMLRGKSKEVWESLLDKLKRLPIQEVHDVMRLSYNDLDDLEKEYFLDIACFFNGLSLKVGYITLLLKDSNSDNSVAAGLESLKDKALITISEDNVISMHDILQEMGREVVRQESREHPEKRTRLWNPDEIYDVLKNDKGTDAIRSISVDSSTIGKLKLSPHVFAKMTNLQFLDFQWGNFHLLPQGLQSFPPNLRYLQWVHYPFKSLPENFSAENLVILNLEFSLVEKLWCGVQDLVNLKEVKLCGSRYLKELPDFSKATNLKVLNIQACENLTNIHPSIFSLDKLVHLDLSFSSSLTTFTNICNLSSVHYLNLQSCNLSEFSVTLENIVELNLSWCPITSLDPSSFGCQSKLEILGLCGTEIESIPSSIKNLTRLRKLDIQDCSKLLVLPELPSSLETLCVDDCGSLKSVLFPSAIGEQFEENKKTVQFRNCLNLDEGSLINIGLNVQINLMKFANFGSDQAVYEYPGSSVPEWLEYKTTKDNMIIDLSSPHISPLLGFVFCFILVEDHQYIEDIESNFWTTLFADKDSLCMFKHQPGFQCLNRLVKTYSRFQIQLKITIIDVDGDDEKHDVDIKMLGPIGIESDHVCMIYNQRCSEYLTRKAKNQTRFKIKVTAWTIPVSIDKERRPEAKLKGFGMSPINQSTYPNLIQQMKYDCAEGESKKNTCL